MKMMEKAIELIKRFEGFRAEPYLCPAGIPTIGYGSTFYADGKAVKLTDQPISESEAELLLRQLVRVHFYDKVAGRLPKGLTDNQLGALLSLAYNIGLTAFVNSRLLRKVQLNPNDDSIKTEFMRWVHVGQTPSAGLTRRREAEAALYTKH